MVPGDGLLPILRATNIQNGLIFDNLVYVPLKYISEEQMLRPGDIIIAASSGSRHIVGKAAQLLKEWQGSWGAFCFGLRPNKSIDAKILAYFLQTSEYRQHVSEQSAGVNINNLQAKHIEQTPMLLAPLPEQHRIVAKIEELFTRLDAGTAALKKVKAELKRYRQAVLKYAFEGKLTAAWREANKDKIEPASVLLERIREGRKKAAPHGKFKDLPPVDTTVLEELLLPQGWVKTTLSELLIVIRGVTYKKEHSSYIPSDDLVPILRATNIQNGLVFENLVYVPKDYVSEDQMLRPGDIVIAASSGSRNIVGKAAQLTREWQGSWGAFCFGLRPNKGIDNHYLATNQSNK